MIRVIVGLVKNTNIVMEKMSKRSIEALSHFHCSCCKKWWTIGDAPQKREKWFCPWCGKENKYGK